MYSFQALLSCILYYSVRFHVVMSWDRSVNYWVENRGLDSLQEQVYLGCHVQTGFLSDVYWGRV
jgi:hypothetical protein